MFKWLSREKKKTKAEIDAELRAELAIKARQFDEENGHLFEPVTEATVEGDEKKSSSITIVDVSARTSFNF